MSADVDRAMPANRGLFACYLALVFWVPIPLGSDRPWSWGLLDIWVFALASWWLLAHVRATLPRAPALIGARPALLLAGLWLGYVWLQLLPLPPALLRLLSPEAARWYAAAAWPAAPGSAPLTLDQHATLQGAINSTAYVAFFALSLVLLDRPGRIAAAAYTLVASGFAQAMYGSITALSGGPGEVAHGGFVNRNHFAGYLELCLSLGLGVLIASLTGEVARTRRQLLRNVVAWILSPKMHLRLALLVMVVGLVLSRSRMGNTAFFVSMLATGAIGLLLSRRATRSMVILLASLVIIDVFIVGAYFGVQRVVDRIEQTRIETERNQVPLAIGVVKDFPVFGSGLGSFYVVFPRYKDADLAPGFYDEAHNDYVQFAAEAGLVGVTLLGLLVLLSFLAALRAHRLHSDPLMRGISFGSMMGIIALMIHSWVDFNLQIPANALTFMLVLAFGWISLYHIVPAPAADAPPQDARQNESADANTEEQERKDPRVAP